MECVLSELISGFIHEVWKEGRPPKTPVVDTAQPHPKEKQEDRLWAGSLPAGSPPLSRWGVGADLFFIAQGRMSRDVL